MAIVYIVRHGNTFDAGDIIRRVGRGTDLPLSQSGQAQAAALGQALADVAFDKALVSPLLRTRMTADAILSTQTVPPKPHYDDRLIEIDYGPDEGAPETDVIQRLGSDAIEAWDKDAIVPSGWQVDPDALTSAWRDLLGAATGTVLIVTSNGVARFVLDVAAHDGVARKLKTGAYGRLEGEGEDWRVRDWNIRP